MKELTITCSKCNEVIAPNVNTPDNYTLYRGGKNAIKGYREGTGKKVYLVQRTYRDKQEKQTEKEIVGVYFSRHKAMERVKLEDDLPLDPKWIRRPMYIEELEVFE